MLSATLVQFVEDHCEAISERIVRHIRHDPRMPHVGSLPESELLDRARDILKHLGEWLTTQAHEIPGHFERLGAHRFKEDLPLEEVVLGYLTVKEQMIETLRDRGLGHSAVQLYAEEELEHSTGIFFDKILFYMVKGYEEALRSSLEHVPAAERHTAGRHGVLHR